MELNQEDPEKDDKLNPSKGLLYGCLFAFVGFLIFVGIWIWIVIG